MSIIHVDWDQCKNECIDRKSKIYGLNNFVVIRATVFMPLKTLKYACTYPLENH